MTTVLLGIIVAMFVVEMLTGGGDVINGPSPARLVKLGASIGLFRTSAGAVGGIAAGQYWRLFTSMFLHAGIFHIAFNAYALWIFGSIVEQELGRFRFLLIYFVTGLFASAASYAFGPPFTPAVGASGAIFGLFGAFIAYNYRRRHLALAAARLRSAIVLIAINAFIAFSIPGIDWRAHAGGLFAGLVAGYVVEGTGSASTRRTILVIGTVGLLSSVVGLVVSAHVAAPRAVRALLTSSALPSARCALLSRAGTRASPSEASEMTTASAPSSSASVREARL